MDSPGKSRPMKAAHSDGLGVQAIIAPKGQDTFTQKAISNDTTTWLDRQLRGQSCRSIETAPTEWILQKVQLIGWDDDVTIQEIQRLPEATDRKHLDPLDDRRFGSIPLRHEKAAPPPLFRLQRDGQHSFHRRLYIETVPSSSQTRAPHEPPARTTSGVDDVDY